MWVKRLLYQGFNLLCVASLLLAHRPALEMVERSFDGLSNRLREYGRLSFFTSCSIHECRLFLLQDDRIRNLILPISTDIPRPLLVLILHIARVTLTVGSLLRSVGETSHRSCVAIVIVITIIKLPSLILYHIHAGDKLPHYH